MLAIVAHSGIITTKKERRLMEKDKSIRITSETYKRLRKISDKEQRTIKATLRMAVLYYELRKQ